MKAKNYELILRRKERRHSVVCIEIDPVLAWGITYAFAMLETYLCKYVGMKVQTLRPTASGVRRWHADEIDEDDVRVCLDLPARYDTPNGEHVSLAVMRDLRLFAIVRNDAGLILYSTQDASLPKLTDVYRMSQFFGPSDMITLRKYLGVSPSSRRRVRYRIGKAHVSGAIEQNPMPRVEFAPHLHEFIRARAQLVSDNGASVMDDVRLVREAIKVVRGDV